MHPDDLARVAEQILHAANSGEPYELEYRLRRASDNSYRWHLSRALPLRGQDGQITSWFGCATDIEELKQAQAILKEAHDEALRESHEQLRLALDAGDIGTWRYDLSTSLFDLDARDRTHWGFDRGTVSLAELIARVHPDDVAHLQQQLAVVRATAANRSRHLLEHRVVHADGAVRWLSVQASVNFEGEGPARRAVLVIGTSQDISDRKDSEQRQQRHEAELAHVARIATMGEMAASLAHELNQPLQAVVTYADGSIMRLAKQPDKDEQLVSTLEQISHEAKRAGQIIRRIRGFVEIGQPQVSEVLLYELVDDCIHLINGELERRRIHVAMELEQDLPPVRGDPVQI